MITVRTPLRVSFFGGGTDYPGYLRRAEFGAVLSAAVKLYCHLSVRDLPPYFPHKNRIVWREVEDVDHFDQVRHPAVREALRMSRADADGVEIVHQADVPARTGLGSSAAFAVGLLHGLHTRAHITSSMRELALDAYRLERELHGDNVGCQDQVACAYGGLNYIRFYATDQIYEAARVNVTAARLRDLEAHLMLIYTGQQRDAATIAADQVERTEQNLPVLGNLRLLAEKGRHLLTKGANLTDFGRLLHDGWHLKQQLSDTVSTPLVDELYVVAREHGAIGGKLLGAGGGGFMLLFTEPTQDAQQRVFDACVQVDDNIRFVPFEFEPRGSRIVHSD